MKRLLMFLCFVPLLAHGATNKISDLTLITSPSTNTFLLVSDMNEATKSRKYLLTNLVTQASFVAELANYLLLTGGSISNLTVTGDAEVTGTLTAGAGAFDDLTIGTLTATNWVLPVAETNKLVGIGTSTNPVVATEAMLTNTIGRTINGTGSLVAQSVADTHLTEAAASALYQATNSTLTRLGGIGAGTSGDILYRDATGWTNLAKGSDGEVLKLASGLPSWAAESGGGATNVTDFSASNAAITNLYASADGTARHDLLLAPRAGGSVSFESPETAVAGNARGAGAVDFQVGRNNATKVASGANSFAAGTNSVASGDNSVALGASTTSSGLNSVAIGAGVTASGTSSTALGGSGLSSGAYTFTHGAFASATIYGQYSHSAGVFASQGDAQHTRFVVRGTTSGNTPVNLLANTARMDIPANTTWSFHVIISARTTDAGSGNEESAGYELLGLIERDNIAADTRLVGSITERVIAEDDAAWSVSATADTTNGSLIITVTGNDETSVRWVATVSITSVSG